MAAPRRYVALVRGINVGGRNALPMARLGELCESVGCTDVSTYIQSGNVLLSSDRSRDGLRAALEEALASELPTAPTVVVRTAAELQQVLAGNPFPQADPKSVHVAFAAEEVSPAGVETDEFLPDELAVRGVDIYLHLPNGLGRSKLAATLERRVPCPVTVRNWRTVSKLTELATG
jgi:uncharacterized protein (DUF1697 family)